jgi:2,4-dienoyl-CoA reductase-like NADH-dependent reductase (Old Yellow Enzyme family)
MLKSLTNRATVDGAHLWAQLGHAGALSHLPISQPQGPSALDLEGLKCVALSIEEIKALPEMYATAASLAKAAGFSGVQIHAGHGFLLSQFLSPLFNHREDSYGGSIEERCRVILEIIQAVRLAVGSDFPIGIRINSTDQIEGGLTEDDALGAVTLIDKTSIDLIDISGGTYFPGAKASSDSAVAGPYFLDFARRAKEVTSIPVMATGGFKTREQVIDALASGAVDMVGLGRAMALNPQLPNVWLTEAGGDPKYPRFESNPPGGVTAWYTMRLTALGEDKEGSFNMDLPEALRVYEARDAERSIKWKQKFS